MFDRLQILEINADNFTKGGMSQVIWRLMENLSNEVEFSFLTDRDDVSEEILDKLESNGARRICLKKNSFNKYINYFIKYHQVIGVFSREKFDFIHINADNMIGVFIYILACKKCHCKIIVQGHTTRFPTDNKFIVKTKSAICSMLYKCLGKNIDVKLAVSTPAAHFFYGEKIKDVHILFNGLDSEKYIYNEEKRIALREKMNVGNKIVVGHIGRFAYAKNHGFLLQVFKDAISKSRMMELWLLGNGPLENEIRLQVQRMGLESNVKFLGTSQDIQMYLSAFDVFLFPSRYEGFPLVLVEAQTSDLPVLMSDTITDEAIFSQKVSRLPLNAPLTEWSDALLKSVRSKEREDMTEKINNAGLNIHEISKRYIKILQENL